MDNLTVLNNLRIASPCPASWSAMAGDDRIRFCGSCEKNVYNLSNLTADEAMDLIHGAEGHLCMRIYRRRDGTVLTADCPVGLRFKLRRRLLKFATAGVLLVATVRSGLWLHAAPNGFLLPPTGPGVTLSDWLDWAAQSLGLPGFGTSAATCYPGGITATGSPSLRPPADVSDPNPFDQGADEPGLEPTEVP